LASLRDRKKRQVRNDILAAAAAHIDCQGYRNANMRDIAAAANVSYQTLYNYFPSKAMLALALVAKVAASREDPWPDGDDDPVSALDTVVRSGIRIIDGHDRDLWREVVAETIRVGGPTVSRRVEPGIRDLLDGLLSGAQQRGALDAYLDVEAMADVIESIFDAAFVRFILDAESDGEALAQAVGRQIEIVLAPRLRNVDNHTL